MTIILKIGGATTGRKFTDPIRYFKANDPYYWEVDNIPLKQLQENVKYVNDRLNTAIVSGNLDTSRADISELKPFVNGSDDRVRVMPGRYTARINNAHNIDHLDSFIRQNNSSDLNGNYTNYAWTDSATLDALIDRINSTVGADSLNLNGLSERAFAYPTRSPDEVPDPDDFETDHPAFKWPLPSADKIAERGSLYSGNIMPILEHIGWYKFAWNYVSGESGATKFLTTAQANEDPNSLMNLGNLENSLIKYWRGTARTAIVDIPTEINVQIRPFDEDDFAVTGATSRIDLVFIYSKPVDTSAVTIGRWTQGPTRSQITKPILGVLEGAGIAYQGVKEGRYGRTGGLHNDGISKMQASIADQNNTDNGFKVGVNQKIAIHGSFPSPEDLLNIAPLLSEQLEEDSWLLTGQTILPVAYVKVNKNAAISQSAPHGIIVDDDIVDIRPLFRTAELTYNERAGIAAAVPPLSIANRAVGRYELEYEINNLHEDHHTRLAAIEKSQWAFTTQHTHMKSGRREYSEIFNTSSITTSKIQEGMKNKIGLVNAPIDYDLSKYIHHSITKPWKVRAVIFTMQSGHEVGGRDTRMEAPRIFMNCETKDSGSLDNVTDAPGKTSFYKDRVIMHFGHSQGGGNADVQGGDLHEFTLPVQYNWDKKKLLVYTWCSDNIEDYNYRGGKSDYPEWYILTIQGYVYDQVHTIKFA